MNKNKPLQKVLNAKCVVATYQVAYYRAEAMFQKYMLCDNLPKKVYKV